MAIRTASLAGAILLVAGPAGQTGQSAYQAWLALGNTGSLADYVAAQKGAPGATQDLSGLLPKNGDASGLTVPLPGAPIAPKLPDIAVANGISVLGFVAAADLAAGNDVSAAFTQAVAAARAANRPLVVPAAPGGVSYVINTSVNVDQVEIVGTGGSISTTAAVDTFVGTTYNAKIHGLKIAHTGPSGSLFNFNSQANDVFGNTLTAIHSTNASPMIRFTGSNNHVFDNSITNLRPNALTWQQIRTDPNLISINCQVVRNYMGGTGQGGWIGDNGSAARPEGTLVALNESVLTGGPFLTLSSGLSMRVIGNMADQGSAKGAIRFEPAGYNNSGVQGVLIQGNYISAVNANAPAIQNIAGVGGAQALGVQIIGNEIAFGSMAAQFVPGITATFSANTMHGFGADHAIEFSNSSLLATVDVGSANQAPGTGLLRVSGGAQAGSVRSTKVGTYATANGGGYLQIPHGLAMPPTKFRVGVSTVGTGGASVASASALVVSVDATNVTLSMTVTGINTQGNIFVTLDSEI